MKILRRHEQVTDEHLPIEPTLLGLPLATPWRRGAAILVDLVLSLFLVLPWITACGLAALTLQAPSAITTFRAYTNASGEGREQAWEDLKVELVKIVSRRRPELLPAEAHAALESGDRAKLLEALSEDNINLDVGSQKPSYYDRSTKTLVIHGDAIYGRLAPIFGGVSALLAYFALFTRWLRGRTPGKWLLGLRVVRLDGKPLTLWDTFGRAGGYTASLSTFGLGFLEALWNPNRQAIHDRISGTVVLRHANPHPQPLSQGERGWGEGSVKTSTVPRS